MVFNKAAREIRKYLNSQLRSMPKRVLNKADKEIINKFASTVEQKMLQQDANQPQSFIAKKLKEAYFGDAKQALIREKGRLKGSKRRDDNSIGFGIYEDEEFEKDERFGHLEKRRVADVLRLLNFGAIVHVSVEELRAMEREYKKHLGLGIGQKTFLTRIIKSAENNGGFLAVMIPYRPFMSESLEIAKDKGITELKKIILDMIKSKTIKIKE